MSLLQCRLYCTVCVPACTPKRNSVCMNVYLYICTHVYHRIPAIRYQFHTLCHLYIPTAVAVHNLLFVLRDFVRFPCFLLHSAAQRSPSVDPLRLTSISIIRIGFLNKYHYLHTEDLCAFRDETRSV